MSLSSIPSFVQLLTPCIQQAWKKAAACSVPAHQRQAGGHRQPRAAFTSCPVPLQDYPKPLVDHQEVHKANIQRHKDAYAHQEEVGEHAEQVSIERHLW